MTIYDYATEPDQAKQLQQAWQEGYESACDDARERLRDGIATMGDAMEGMLSTRASRYLAGWSDAMLEAVLIVSGLDGGKGESCEQG
jgi:hypothetical protein